MAWKNRVTQIDGRAAQVLVDDRFVGLDHAPVPKRWWFGVWTSMPAEGAFWNPEETAALDELEDTLRKAWTEKADGPLVYVGRVATAGVREYYLYSSYEVELANTLHRARGRHPGYRIEMETSDDPQWTAYGQLLDAILPNGTRP